MEEKIKRGYEDEINLWELLVILAKRKKIIIRITLLFFIVSIIYSLLATPQYQVNTVLTSNEESVSSSMSSLGNIASNVLGSNLNTLFGGQDLVRIQRTLGSSDFLFYLEKEYDLRKILELEEGLKKGIYLQKIRNLITINRDDEKNLLIIKILHKNPVKAYNFLNNLMNGLNEFIVQKQYRESEMMEKVLKEKIKNTQNPLLKTELTKLWSNETKKMLYSKINKNNLYKVIQSPYIPDKRVKPKRKIIVIISTFLGFFISIFLVFFLEFISKSKNDPENREYFQKFIEYLELDRFNFFKRRR